MLDPFSNYVCSREMAQENSSNADNLTWKLSPKERLWVQAQIVCGWMLISMNVVARLATFLKRVPEPGRTNTYQV
jgi:hypothetical protein